MNLFAKLLARKEAGTPVRVGLIGAGKFGSMFLAQARKIPAIHIAGIADLSPERARANLAFVDWKEETYHSTHLDDACAHNTTFITDDASLLIADERINIIIEATGDPVVAVDHIIAALDVLQTRSERPVLYLDRIEAQTFFPKRRGNRIGTQ